MYTNFIVDYYTSNQHYMIIKSTKVPDSSIMTYCSISLKKAKITNDAIRA